MAQNDAPHDEVREAVAGIFGDDFSIDPDEDKSFKNVIVALISSIERLRRMAVIIFTIAGVLLITAGLMLPELSDRGAQKIIDHPDSLTLFLYEMVRTAAFAGVVTAALWGMFNLGRTTLDQATRYEKRLIAANFLNYALHTYQEEIREGKIRLDEIMVFLKSWSENVESAYTHFKFGSKRGEDFSVGASPRDGMYVIKGPLRASSSRPTPPRSDANPDGAGV